MKVLDLFCSLNDPVDEAGVRTFYIGIVQSLCY
jgi:hypothetical protein